MTENNLYLAVGEEAVRGTAEKTTLGFIPLMSPGLPTVEPDDRARKEFRGDKTVLGDTTMIRMMRKWSGSIEFPMFTEAGTVAGMVGTLFKHFFGTVTSAENGATGQFGHHFYPTADPFSAANLDNDALTFNFNLNEGATVRNWPFVGGRVGALTFAQEAGEHLIVTADIFGQKQDTRDTAIASPAFAAENLRCDYNNLTVYQGAITRTGTPPDYTDYAAGSGVVIVPDSVTIKLENGMEDVMRLSGTDYPDKTRMGLYKVNIEMTLDWTDPASGFSSADEVAAWIDSITYTNFAFHWDTGTQAGTGDNHGMWLDVPRCHRVGGQPEYDLEKDPMITLSYEGLYDAATAEYLVAMLLKNTVTAV